MAVTLRDVASKVGVTPVVVSRVLHNKANGIRVSEATAQRIREAAEELGYRVNVWARNFRNQQTMTIGVLHGTGFPRPLFDRGSRYFAALMDGIVEGAFKHGYSVTLCPKLLGQDSDAMNDGRFDGLVWYSTSPSPEMKEQLIKSQAPLVVLHAHASDFGGRIPTIICDNRQGIRLALDHLVELGHRSIGFPWEHELGVGEALERRNAFVSIAAEMGISFEVIDVSWGRQEVDEYLKDGPKHTAIVCFSDGLAGDFIQAAPKYGISLPADLSIVGFDSTGYCNELNPALTSVRQPLAVMGAKAIEVLVKRINGEVIEPLETVMACGFDVRESTANLKS
jgi:DNA-binding LacI/PurR family transcriptional regulator